MQDKITTRIKNVPIRPLILFLFFFFKVGERLEVERVDAHVLRPTRLCMDVEVL